MEFATKSVASLCAVIACVTACQPDATGKRSEGQVAIPVSGAPSVPVQERDSLSKLIGRIAQLEGRYVQFLNGRWEFEGDLTVFKAIRQFEDSAVTRLLGCIDDSTPTSVTVEGRPVLLGILCLEALYRTAYYEPSESEQPWPGYVTPLARTEDLIRAKEAWTRIVRLGAYKTY